MSRVIAASPRIRVMLYKTIARKTVDGVAAASTRYQGKSEEINLTPYLNDRSSVRTTKSVREPAGAFTITFADKPNKTFGADGSALESVYGLVEPMDMVEIRMWGGTGVAPAPAKYPIIMRGFVSDVQRSQSMTDSGQPQRQVVVSGLDYGKIWQIFQVIYLMAYAERKALLTSFGLWELFGVEVKSNSTTAAEFVRIIIEKIINPHLDKFIPKNSPMKREILTGKSISVVHGRVSNAYQRREGSIYDMLRFYGDVGVWNELYTEDREDGVHCVYRAIPALHITKPKDAKDSKIQDDAPDPVYVVIPDALVQSLSVGRTDANVANFYWVGDQLFDLIDEMQRKLSTISENDGTAVLSEYPNSAVKYYGIRQMRADTQQGGDTVQNMKSGVDKDEQPPRLITQSEWIKYRRKSMADMNKDNVVFERGTARIKGGIMRDDGLEAMKAGDYAVFKMGRIRSEAYVVQIEHEFMPFQSYTTTLTFERSTGFVKRIEEGKGSGISSPWLAEQASQGR